MLEKKLQHAIAANLSDQYLFALSAERKQWQSNDLASYVNRSRLRKKGGWIAGPPLEFLESGIQVFHGVPFAILPENDSHRQSFLTLRSQQIQRTGPQSLKSKMGISVGQHFRALYFLHGAAWITSHRPIGEYCIHLADGSAWVLPVTPCADPPLDPQKNAEWIRSSTAISPPPRRKSLSPSTRRSV